MNLRTSFITSFMMALALTASAPVQALDDSTSVRQQGLFPRFDNGNGKFGGTFKLYSSTSMGGVGGYVNPFDLAAYDWLTPSDGPPEGRWGDWYDQEGGHIIQGKCTTGNLAVDWHSPRCACPPADSGNYLMLQYADPQVGNDTIGYWVSVVCYQIPQS